MAASVLFLVGQDVDGGLGCCIAGFWCEHTAAAPQGYDSHCLRARNEPRFPHAAVRGDRAGSWDRATCTIRKSAHRGFRRGYIEEMFPCTVLRVIVP